jgi:uncharacterized protein
MSDGVAVETWPSLKPLERRVLGVLVEKQKTSKSPDAYPMTLNGLTIGCNQKSNRDPVYELGDDEVEETLTDLQKQGLVAKVVGGRTDRYRHLLYEAWKASKIDLAILAELLLRGPQSEGDLRGRADRMTAIPDLDSLRQALKGLSDRRLVVYLTPPDRRGAVVTHGFHSPAELEAARSGSVGAAEGVPVVGRAGASGVEAKLTEAFDLIARLRSDVNAIRAELDRLKNP